MSTVYIARFAMTPFAVFTTYADAEFAAEEQVRGGYKEAGDVLELPLYPDIHAWAADQKARLREKALAKLSREEREALGLDH